VRRVVHYSDIFMSGKKDRLASRVRNIGTSAIREMMLLGSKVPGAISLAQGIPDARTPAYIRDGVIELLQKDHDIGKYAPSPGLPQLRKLAADSVSTKGGFSVDWETQICITAGAIEALAIATSTLVEEGDEVLLPDPGYPPYMEQIAFAKGKAVYVPLNAERGWRLDLQTLERAITPKTKLLILANPSNPTGMVMGKDELEGIAALSAKHGFFVIADITYDFLVYDHAAPPSLLAYPEIRDNLLLCYSFSKEFSMTGWRAGFLYAPSYIYEQAAKVHDAFLLCAPTISQRAALIALTKRPSEDPEGIHANLAEKREVICKRLDALSDLFSYSKPEGAYYVFAKYRKTRLDSRAFARKMLEEAKVICVPGIGFGPNGEGHVRFSYGCSRENLYEAFDRLERWNGTLGS